MGEVKIKSGNLFDKNNATVIGSYIASETGIITYSTTAKSVVIPCQANTTYSVSKTKGTRFAVGCYDSNPSNGDTATNWTSDHAATSITIATTANSQYLVVFFYYAPSETDTYEQVLATLMLNLGSTALPYQPYFLNKPAHQFVNGQWVDIPTHHYTNGRWQGELTSQSPLEFKATGQSLLDWRVDGKTSENLFDINGEHISVSRNGIKCFIVDDGKLIVQIISPGHTTQISYPNNFYNPAVYTVSAKLTGELTSIRFLSTSPFPGGTYNATYKAYFKSMTLNDGIYTITVSPTETTTIGFVVAGADDAQNPGTVEDIQILSGTYTSSTIPPYEPYGNGVGDWDETTQRYKIPIVVEGENLFNPETSTSVYLDVRGVEHPSEKSLTSAYISVNANTMYTLGLTGDTDSINNLAYCFYNSNKEFISSGTYVPSANGNIVNLLTPNDCAYFRFTYNHLRELVEFVEGSYTTLPPYSTTTNLYTDHQLMDGDSIDYATDQTAIPIVTGNNTLTVDAAVQPSKVFVKFEG